MVMRNRHDGANAPEWWDDLPPGIKSRCTHSLHHKSQDRGATVDQLRQQPDNSSSPVSIARDLSWLALIFVIIALANILFLFAALSYLHGDGPFAH
jgi:hypothetical protein